MMQSFLLRFCFGLVVGTVALGAAEAPARDKLAEAVILAPQGGTASEDAEIARWQERVRADGAKAENFERLGWALIAKARRTLDAGYYKLAEKTAEAMDARFGVSGESRLLRGHVLHNLHRFREAEAVARALVAERGLATDLALLSDALMEQGKLTEAVEALQRMVNVKPGAEAYSRIAQVRWLKGDLRGAIAAMQEAEWSSDPRDAETNAWLLTRLASFYLQSGELPRSQAVAETALKRAPAYPPALLARGRALLALGQTEAAVGVLERAVELNPLPEYQWWLADALRAAGRTEAAAKTEAELKAHGEAADPRTLALFLATRHEEAPWAVKLAQAELENRTDVQTHDALAWALAASGDLPAAETEMRVALAEHTADARLWWHAGEIALGRGQPEAAQVFFEKAQPLAAALTPAERAQLEIRLTPKALAVSTASALPAGAAERIAQVK